MSAIIISILVDILGAFLTSLFEKWFGGGSRQAYLVNENYRDALGNSLTHAKSDFISKVKWRIWLGPKRVQFASALYDRAQSRLQGSMVQLSANAAELARFAVDGLEKLEAESLVPTRKRAVVGPSIRRFTVTPDGLIKGGRVAYSCDAEGNIAYQATITAGKWIFTKTYEFSGKYKVDPSMLVPAALTVGKVVLIGDLSMRVVQAGATAITVAITAKTGTGTAVLSAYGNQVTLLTLDAVATVSGYQVNLALRRS